jgi:hypothetical protein
MVCPRQQIVKTRVSVKMSKVCETKKVFYVLLDVKWLKQIVLFEENKNTRRHITVVFSRHVYSTDVEPDLQTSNT